MNIFPRLRQGMRLLLSIRHTASSTNRGVYVVFVFRSCYSSSISLFINASTASTRQVSVSGSASHLLFVSLKCGHMQHFSFIAWLNLLPSQGYANVVNKMQQVSKFFLAHGVEPVCPFLFGGVVPSDFESSINHFILS